MKRPVYTSDESIVVISDERIVTAVSPGSAYIVYKDPFRRGAKASVICVQFTVNESKPVDEPAPNTPEVSPSLPDSSSDYTQPPSEMSPEPSPGPLPSQASEDLPEPEGSDDWIDRAQSVWDNLPNQGQRDLRTIHLGIGESDTPMVATVWPLSATYSTDKAVVTVNSDGVVTAVGSGDAKVMFLSDAGAVDCLLYIVE